MNTKLTLRLDQELVRRAKSLAKQRGKSVSQMVAEYFQLLGRARVSDEDLNPTVQSLKGVLRGKGVEKRDYQKHLEDKFL